MKYQITITQITTDVPYKEREYVRAAIEEEGHYEYFDSVKDVREEVYNQTVDKLDLPKLVTIINSN